MSEQEQAVVEEPKVQESPGSLRARMRARSQELEQQRTELFPVPGYAEVLRVELMPLGWETMSRIVQRVAEVRDPSLTQAIRQLYVAADQLVAATVKFYEVDENGNVSEIDDSWKTLAEAALETFRQDATPRQAVLALINKPTSPLLMFFYQEWLDWMSSERSSANVELGQDFGKTR